MRNSAEELAYLYIKREIANRRLLPNERISPEKIAEQLSLSRMPVRSAIKRLVTEHFLSITDTRRIIVMNFNYLDMEEIFYTRSVLEGLAAKFAVKNMRLKKQIFEFDLESMEAESINENIWIDLHKSFHMKFYMYAEMPRLITSIDNLMGVVEPYMRDWISKDDFRAHSMNGHRELYHVINSGTPEDAEEIIKEHVLDTIPDLKKYYGSISN